MLLYFLAVFSLFYGVNGQCKCTKKLEDAKIVPNYADYGTSGNLKVVYGKNHKVECGNAIPTLSTLNAPVVTFDVKGKCKYLSIIMFDPDQPIESYLYWFVINIPSNVMKKGYKQNGGQELAKYVYTVEPTGSHRITICVYCQKKWIRSCANYNYITSKAAVNPRKLAQQYNLQGPQACNFFYWATSRVKLLDDQPAFENIYAIYKNLGNKDKTKILK